jgi:hypothetical protein
MYLNEVRKAKVDFALELPNHCFLLMLEYDNAYTFLWALDCEAQLQALEKGTSICFILVAP